MLYALSSKQQQFFADRINLFVGIAPAGKINNLGSPGLKYIMSKALYIQLDVFNKFVRWYRLFDRIERMLTRVNCIFVPDICFFFVDRMIYSSEIGLDDPKKYQVLMGHMPGGVGLKNLFSYFQTFLTGKFQDWDYDMEFLASKSNWEEYGQAKPP